MKVVYWSDIHVDVGMGKFYSYLMSPEFVGDPDAVLVIAGDVANRIEHVRMVILTVCPKYKKVFYIPGNHEYWNANQRELGKAFEDLELELDNFTYLNRKYTIYEGVLFVGATLWTDYDNGAPSVLFGSRHEMRYDLNNIGALPEDLYAWHQFDRGFIFQTLRRPEYADLPAVVVTHHAPSEGSIHAKYQNEGLCNYSFVSNLDAQIVSLEDVRTDKLHWIHGHVHNRFEYCIGWQCFVHCNPRGYPNETVSSDFAFDIDAHFNIEIEQQ